MALQGGIAGGSVTTATGVPVETVAGASGIAMGTAMGTAVGTAMGTAVATEQAAVP
eukprot:CAMPEP_0181243520 /NCGR_PEP_ID=MMETSP1096-20121128/42321_1 /TAXON_ID=156174 ORGANISM="Chrysochromulina ericina, Strain CCMP281" /NCGR_SAMPLE_ID=MMETSP1096 /ASSEMBLY_ACC=CAM_ASM_000453 /LENGTH=55 /DNA_ID=CAMNT_0023339909 /DNA_START=61 /DNA_END=224 /DNA_ORIENTATION=-